jgi:hypothetical protein
MRQVFKPKVDSVGVKDGNINLLPMPNIVQSHQAISLTHFQVVNYRNLEGYAIEPKSNCYNGETRTKHGKQEKRNIIHVLTTLSSAHSHRPTSSPKSNPTNEFLSPTPSIGIALGLSLTSPSPKLGTRRGLLTSAVGIIRGLARSSCYSTLSAQNLC